MKKVFAILAVAAAFTFAACSESKTETTEDTTKTDTVVAEPEVVPADTTVKDSASADSAK